MWTSSAPEGAQWEVMGLGKGQGTCGSPPFLVVAQAAGTQPAASRGRLNLFELQSGATGRVGQRAFWAWGGGSWALGAPRWEDSGHGGVSETQRGEQE